MSIDLKKRTIGRPTSLTDQVWKKLVNSVENNNYLSVACQSAGINRRTFTVWMNWAKDVDQYIEDNNIDMPETLPREDTDIYNAFPEDVRVRLVYWYLFQDLKIAEANGIESLNEYIMDAAPKNWLAAMTLLERRHPDMYGKRDAVDVNVQAGQQLLQDLAKILKPDNKQLPGGTVR
jgi:hypothetical protein